MTEEQKERKRAYDRQRKREVRRLKREGKWEPAAVQMSTRETRKLTKNHNRSRPFHCEHCGDLWYHRYGESNRFCCQTCASDYERAKWTACCDCLGKLGLGAETSARVIKIVTKTQVKRYRKENNRQTYRAGCGHKTVWHQARKERTRQRKLWKQYERAWVKECEEPNFVDWTCLGDRWLMRKYQRERYKARPYSQWTEEEKRAHNEKTNRIHQAKLESDPEYKARCCAYAKKWKLDNPDKVRKYAKKARKRRIKRDPGFKIQCNMRHRFKDIMRKARRGGTKWDNKMIGCTSEQLAKHLESQFSKRMTWDNYGTYWHVDHIMPCAEFDHTDPQQVAQCWHWTNLQPLEAHKNLDKSNKIQNPQLSLMLCATH